MNVYFLLEDSKSFLKVLPHWLSYELPNFSRIRTLAEFNDDGDKFLLQSGFGYPQIKKNFEQTVLTLYEENIPVDCFVVCFDSDAQKIQKIESEKKYFESVFIRYSVKYRYKIFVLDRCFETWLLGNRSVCLSASISKNFKPYLDFYDVTSDDPEKMNSPNEFSSVSAYHLKYLQEMLHCSENKKNYSKGSPLAVSTKEYFQELCLRTEKTADLRSFKKFLDFLKSCN